MRPAGTLLFFVARQSTYFGEWFGLPDHETESALVAFYDMKEGETPDTPRVAKLAAAAEDLVQIACVTMWNGSGFLLEKSLMGLIPECEHAVYSA